MVAPTASGQISTDEMQATAASDCWSGYSCLFQYPGYGGRVLRWSQSGNKYLSKWDFRDRASAECNNRSRGAHGEDYRTGLPDPEIWFGAWNCYNDFRNYSYPSGGNWNNKMDLFVLS
jgi:Peptidase inhibitor family I36